jgi:hypothetical protein
MDKLPFFYYDILSRIIPGAATLGALLFFPYWIPLPRIVFDRVRIWSSFSENGAAVVVPLVLVGACYMIGVLFEAVDYLPGLRGTVLKWDGKAFAKKWCKSEENRKIFGVLSPDERERLRFKMWETLVYRGGRDTGIGTVFSHCHRFQAEYKMFLHLSYTALLFLVLWTYPWGISKWTFYKVVCCVLCASLFLVLAHLRNGRRWLQTISFCSMLKDSDEKDKETAGKVRPEIDPGLRC